MVFYIYEVVVLKYFIDSAERKSSVHENYIEIQTSKATEEFWDETSLYMPYGAVEQSKLGYFLEHCMRKDVLFDSETISKEDWLGVLTEAEMFNENTYEAICELREWIKNQFEDVDQTIRLIWESERTLERRRAERDAYPVSQEFYEEVKAIDSNLSFEKHQEEYEKLLDKYNMPSCFYPFPLFDPDKWN